MNAFKKSLIVAASFASLSLFNSAVADMVYKPVEQPVEPVKPDLKIESVNEKFAEKYTGPYITQPFLPPTLTSEILSWSPVFKIHSLVLPVTLTAEYHESYSCE